tara:strand:- start:140170 stop:140382 length:213 start_codon:yes stop_codon:yes gene_type:complete
MNFELALKVELYFVIGAVLYLMYTRIEQYFPTMADVNKRLTYALLFFFWPLMVVVLAEEYVKGKRNGEDQ